MKKKFLTFKGFVEKRQKPKNLKQEDIYLFEHEFEKKINNSFVFSEKNLLILNKNIFKLKKLKLYFSHTYMNRPTLKNLIKLIIQYMYLIRQPKEKLDSGVWIINNKSENYFHWMTESLTRVLSFKEINQESVILLPELLNKYEFVSKTLDSLGAEYKFYNDDYIYNIKNLFLTSHTAPAGNYNSEIIRLLHSNLNKALSQPQKKRFWLSRKYSGRRILLNEELIIPILEKFNIEIFYPEKHSYSEQVDNYRKAEFIGGIHGAALTNMLYMEKNSNVLELRDANDYHNNCYYSLASSLENNFYYLLCTSDNDGNSTVNYDDLENLLEVIFRS